MVFHDFATEDVSDSVHQIALFSAAQDGSLFTLFQLLDALPGQVERNKAINMVSRADLCFLLFLLPLVLSPRECEQRKW